MKYLLIIIALALTGCASGPLPQRYTSNGVERVRIQDSIVWEAKPFRACMEGNTVRSCP